jgi:hypothetical protein
MIIHTMQQGSSRWEPVVLGLRMLPFLNSFNEQNLEEQFHIMCHALDLCLSRMLRVCRVPNWDIHYCI